jgi:hypothetical protein
MLAHPAFETFMAERHVEYVQERFGEQADTRDRLARERGEREAYYVRREERRERYEREETRPVQNLTVRQERMSQTQTRLNRVKARYN